MSTETPIYDQLAAESEWTPDQLHPPLDLNDWLARSYMRAMVRAQLLRKMAHRSKVAQKRRPRHQPLP